MKKTYKKKEEKLTSEGSELRQPVAELEAPATERKQAEEKLRESEDKYRTIFENVSDVIIRLDKYGKVLDINGKSEECFGYKPEEVIGRNFAAIGALHLKDMPKLVRLFGESMRGKSAPSTIEVGAKCKDGSSVLLEVNTTLVKREGKIEGTVAIVRNITERKQAEEKLRESEEFSTSLLSNSPNPISVINPDTSIRYVNPALEKLTGFSLAELSGRKAPYPYWVEEVQDKNSRGLKKSMRRKVFRMEELFCKKNGGRFWVEITSAPIIKDGKLKYLLSNWVDITGRKQVRERLQTILKTALDGFWLTNLEGKLLEVNNSYCRMIGYTRKELLKMHISDLEATENPRQVSRHIKRIIEQGYDRFESQHKHKDGRIINVEISVNHLDAGEGQLFVFARDITERKKAEQALRDSEEKARKMFESVSDGISVVDLDGVITQVNRRVVEMHGLGSKAELLGKSAFDIVAPSDREKIARNMRQALKRGTVRDQEYTLLKADGSEFPAELSTSALKDASGKLIGHVTISRDITERKKAAERLQTILKTALDGFWLTNLEGKILEVNDSYCKMVGYTRQELLKMSTQDVEAIENPGEVAQHIAKIIKQGYDSFESQHKRKDGQIIDVEISVNYLDVGEGQLFIFARDITERKQAEKRERELQRELYFSSRLAAIGELAAGIAHQINNPLTGVLGFSQRLLRKSTDQETNQDLKRIYSEAERAAKVVQNLLTFARRRQPQKQYSDVNDILESSLELRTYELKTSNIEVVTDLAPSLPELMLDFHQIQEIFLNIILNAEQAMTEANSGGKLTIKTEERKGYIRTTFTDNGPGIPAENLEKIFDPFFSTKGEKGGTGLGLSVCHGIISEHGGRIYAKSKSGKGGATFFIELPLPEH